MYKIATKLKNLNGFIHGTWLFHWGKGWRRRWGRRQWKMPKRRAAQGRKPQSRPTGRNNSGFDFFQLKSNCAGKVKDCQGNAGGNPTMVEGKAVAPDLDKSLRCWRVLLLVVANEAIDCCNERQQAHHKSTNSLGDDGGPNVFQSSRRSVKSYAMLPHALSGLALQFTAGTEHFYYYLPHLRRRKGEGQPRQSVRVMFALQKCDSAFLDSQIVVKHQGMVWESEEKNDYSPRLVQNSGQPSTHEQEYHIWSVWMLK